MSPSRPVTYTALTALLLVVPVSADAQARGAATGCRWGDGGPHPTIFGMLVPASDSARAPDVYLGTLLQEALTAFQPPDTITTAVGGVMSMWLHADGRLSDVRAVDTVLAANLVNALRLAIESMVQRGGIGPVPPPLTGDSIPLHLIMHWAGERTPLSVPVLRLQPLFAYY